mmetsp:Transcript_3798/g.7644  ORF Transcript_3798/g.7644 Transcript_3798/m.7644 type:complete len:131 (+) Transcript_3798:97-489(+)
MWNEKDRSFPLKSTNSTAEQTALLSAQFRPNHCTGIGAYSKSRGFCGSMSQPSFSEPLLMFLLPDDARVKLMLSLESAITVHAAAPIGSPPVPIDVGPLGCDCSDPIAETDPAMSTSGDGFEAKVGDENK